MRNNVKGMFISLLTEKEKKKVLLSLFFMSFFTVVEVIGVSLVPLYINWVIVGAEDSVFAYIGVDRKDELIVGAVLGIFVAVGTYFSYLIIKISLTLSHKIGARVSSKIISLFLKSKAQIDQSDLINQVTLECDRLSSFIITPLFFIFSRLCLSILLVSVLLIYNFKFAFPAIVLVGFIFFILFWSSRGRLAKQGSQISKNNSERIQEIKTVYGLKKEISLYSKEKSIINRFAELSFDYGRNKASIELISKQPRYVFETVVLAGGVILALVLSSSSGIDSLEFMLVFGVVGYKLMPAIHQLQSFYSIFKGNSNAVSVIYESLKNLEDASYIHTSEDSSINEVFESLEIKHLQVASEHGPLAYSNIIILPGKVYGILGPSGSGKSSFMEAIAGVSNRVISAEILLNGKSITYSEFHFIAKNLIAYVPQSTSTYGINLSESISLEKGKVGLDTTFYNYAWSFKPRQFQNTLLEDCLSGGEKQRLNLARAFFFDRDISLFDESMSGLDNSNKTLVWKDLNEYVKNNRKTIVVISHDKSDLNFVDEIIDLVR